MPFSEEQKNRHIKELQHSLYVISLDDERIPAIIPDGSYTKDTKGAVRVFQNAYGIRPTGETDKETHKKITEVFHKFNLKPVSLDIFPKNYILLPNSRGDLVYIIQIMLNMLSRDYENLSEVETDGFYSPQMNEAVIRFKEISDTDKDINGIGTETWNTLVRKVNSKDFSAHIKSERRR